MTAKVMCLLVYFEESAVKNHFP